MTPREAGKNANRAAIRRAAEAIIRADGFDALNMRRLADEAGVSLRTPYNLFGSKTAILLAILDWAASEMHNSLRRSDCDLGLEYMFRRASLFGAFYAQDEVFYRDVYRAVIVADQCPEKQASEEATTRAYTRGAELAAENGEIDPAVSAAFVGRQMAMQIMGLLGMWADQHMTLEETIWLAKMSWASTLAPLVTGKAAGFIETARREAYSAMTREKPQGTDETAQAQRA